MDKDSGQKLSLRTLLPDEHELGRLMLSKQYDRIRYGKGDDDLDSPTLR